MPRPKGSKNKKTLEREAQERAATPAASSVSTPQTETTASPNAKAKVTKTQPVKAPEPTPVKAVKSQTLPEVKENAKYVIEMCDHIFKNLHPQQQAKWQRGVGKAAPHYASPAHYMAATLISYFDLGILKEETLQFFTKP